MIQREASSNAKMHAALSTNEARTLACGRRCAALDTVSVFVGGEWIMIHGQRSGRVGTCSIALRLLLGWQLLQQFVHELLTKAQLPTMLLPFRPELKSVDNAHVQQPPRQTRPAPLRFATRQVGVVQLRKHIDGAGAIEVITDGAGAADRNLATRVVPALKRSSLAG